MIRFSNPNKEKKTLFIWPEGFLVAIAMMKF